MIRNCLCSAALWPLLASGAAWGADAPSSQPKPVPATRTEMKKALEALKQRQARLPLPPPAAGDQQPGGRPTVNNGRARALYLPASWGSGNRNRPAGTGAAALRQQQDPAMTLDYGFKTRLFWIVSRGNNCHYCLGHQELKLRDVGMTDDQIAALDVEWQAFPEKEQAAMRLTRKMTIEPHAVGDADVADLTKQFNDREVVEIVYTVAGYNSTNRWTDSLGLPQDMRFSEVPTKLDTPTSAAFSNRPTQVVPLSDTPRPALESRAEVERHWAQCRARRARVALLSEAEARAALPKDFSADKPPQWLVALCYFPETAANQARLRKAVAEEGRTPARLKAQIAWIAARQNRAWYSLAHAKAWLGKLGQSDEQVFALDGDWTGFTPAEREAFAFARKLTAYQRSIADDDIARLRKHYADAEVAEIVYLVCSANMFDRFTETLALPLEL